MEKAVFIRREDSLGRFLLPANTSEAVYAQSREGSPFKALFYSLLIPASECIFWTLPFFYAHRKHYSLSQQILKTIILL